jgi:hypothetical protein
MLSTLSSIDTKSNGRAPESPLAVIPSGDPRGCSAISVEVRCQHALERGFLLRLPVAANQLKAPGKHKIPYLEVISTFNRTSGMDHFIIQSEGPLECPPGVENRLFLQLGNQMERIPVGGEKEIRAFSITEPLPVEPDELTERFLNEFAPWCWSGIQPATGMIVAESCRASGTLQANFFVFPHISASLSGVVEWRQNRRTGQIEPDEGGVLTLRYNGEERAISLKWLKPQIEAKCPISWSDLMNILQDLSTGCALAAMEGDSRQSTCQMPKLDLSGSGALTEKKGSPDVEARYSFRIEAAPLVEVDYEYNLLPWLEANTAASPGSPPKGGFGAKTKPNFLFRLCRKGIWLSARGRITFNLEFKSSYLTEENKEVGEAEGLIAFKIEGEPERECEAIVIELTATDVLSTTALKVSGKCWSTRKLPEHHWNGHAAFGGVVIHDCASSSAKVVLYSKPQGETPPSLHVFKAAKWW